MLWLLALVPMLAGAAVFAAQPQRRGMLAAAAALACAATLVLAWLAASRGWSGAIEWGGALRLTAALPPLAAMVAMTVPAVGLAVLAFAAAHEERAGLARLVALLLFFIGAMELVVVADDLLTLLVGWELVGACSWALIGHEWRDAGKPRSGLYAFVMTRFGDLGLFIAAMAAFAGAGSFAYADLARIEGPLLGVIVLGVVVAAASKSGQLPFSPWLFRAMDGPVSVSALLHAATMVAAGAYLLVRLHPMLDRVAWFGPLAIGIGIATALAGGVVALLQDHAKKVLAASTSAHFGLMFVAVGAGYPGVAALHLVAHAAFKALLFLVAGIAGARAGGYGLHAMRLGAILPRTALLGAVGALALAGVPPLGAAWTKEAIVAAAGHASLVLALTVMAAGGLSAAYATRFQLLAFGRAGAGEAEAARGAELAAVALLAFASVALSLLWWPRAHAFVAALLDVRIAEAAPWEVGASLAMVAAGILAGRLLAHGGSPAPAIARDRAADWFMLPALIDAAVVVPVGVLARALARFDDMIVDGAVRRFTAFARNTSAGLAWGDGRIVDRGVLAAERLVFWLSATGSGATERIADGVPEGLARITALAGRDARRLQGGMSHHYFALLAAGAALLTAFMLVGN